MNSLLKLLKRWWNNGATKGGTYSGFTPRAKMERFMPAPKERQDG